MSLIQDLTPPEEYRELAAHVEEFVRLYGDGRAVKAKEYYLRMPRRAQVMAGLEHRRIVENLGVKDLLRKMQQGHI